MATGILRRGAKPPAIGLAMGVFRDRSVLRGDNPCWMSALACQQQSSIVAYFSCLRAKARIAGECQVSLMGVGRCCDQIVIQWHALTFYTLMAYM